MALRELTQIHPKDVPAQPGPGAFAAANRRPGRGGGGVQGGGPAEPDNPGHEATCGTREELARRWGKLLPRTPGHRRRTRQPQGPADALALANLCREPFQRRYALSASLAARRSPADPPLADNLAAGYRFHAATAAAPPPPARTPTSGRERRGMGLLDTGSCFQWLLADLRPADGQAKDPKQDKGGPRHAAVLPEQSGPGLGPRARVARGHAAGRPRRGRPLGRRGRGPRLGHPASRTAAEQVVLGSVLRGRGGLRA